jgi:hypothetical protein
MKKYSQKAPSEGSLPDFLLDKGSPCATGAS